MRGAPTTVEKERAKRGPAFHFAPGSTVSWVKRLSSFGPPYEPVSSDGPGRLYVQAQHFTVDWLPGARMRCAQRTCLPQDQSQASLANNRGRNRTGQAVEGLLRAQKTSSRNTGGAGPSGKTRRFGAPKALLASP